MYWESPEWREQWDFVKWKKCVSSFDRGRIWSCKLCTSWFFFSSNICILYVIMAFPLVVVQIHLFFWLLFLMLNLLFLSYFWFLFRGSQRSRQLVKNIFIVGILKQLLQTIHTGKIYLRKILSEVSFHILLSKWGANLCWTYNAVISVIVCVRVLFLSFKLKLLIDICINWTYNRKSNTVGFNWFFKRACWIWSCKTLVTLPGNQNFKLYIVWLLICVPVLLFSI